MSDFSLLTTFLIVGAWLWTLSLWYFKDRQEIENLKNRVKELETKENS